MCSTSQSLPPPPRWWQVFCLNWLFLPKDGSRVGIGDTWNDKRLFQSNGDVLDLIVHYWWNRLLHFCGNNSRKFHSVTPVIRKFIAHQSIEFVQRYCSAPRPASANEVSGNETFSEHRSWWYLWPLAHRSVACGTSSLKGSKRRAKVINSLINNSEVEQAIMRARSERQSTVRSFARSWYSWVARLGRGKLKTFFFCSQFRRKKGKKINLQIFCGRRVSTFFSLQRMSQRAV